MATTQAQSSTTARRVIGGRVEGNLYLITLDGNEVVETADETMAAALAQSKRDNRAVEIDLLRTPGRRAVIEQMRVLADAPASEPKAESKPTSQAQSAPSTQQLVKAPALPQGLISRPDELASQMAAMSSAYNVLSPAIAVSEMAPGYGANLAVVRIDPTITIDEYGNGSGPDCYFSKSIHKTANKVSLRKEGLLKISQAAGIQWDPRECRRVDDGKERNYWHWKYYGVVRTHDGQLQPVSGSRELDLRDGSAEAAEMKSPQLAKARASGNQICETKAMERAIRTLGVRQSYTVDELRKPFVIVRFSFMPDMNDPEIKKLVTQHAISGMGALYPPASPVSLPPPTETAALPAASPEPATAPQSAKTDPFAESAASQPATPATPALPPDATYVANVEPKQGKNKEGRTWTLYKVTFETGEVASTFSESLHKLIDEARAQHLPVRIKTVENEGYDDKLESLTLIDTRQGILPGTGTEGRY